MRSGCAPPSRTTTSAARKCARASAQRASALELAARHQQAAVDAALADERRRSAAAYAKLDAELQAERQETGRLCTEVRQLKAAARAVETDYELRLGRHRKEIQAFADSMVDEERRRAREADARADEACEAAAALQGAIAALEDQLEVLRGSRVGEMGNERLAEQLKFYKLIEKKTGFKTTGAAAWVAP